MTTKKQNQEPEQLQVMSVEEFRANCVPKTELLPVPEYLPGYAIRVRGYDVAQTADIRAASTRYTSDGKAYHDEKQDRFLSLVAAIAKPAVTGSDEWLFKLPDGLADRIINLALKLSGREVSAYEHLKESMRENPYIRRMYTVCFEVLGRAPCELRNIPESEINTYLAAAEVSAEEWLAQQEREAKEKKPEE